MKRIDGNQISQNYKKLFLTMNVKDYEKFLQFFYANNFTFERVLRQIMRNISINLCSTKYSLMYMKKRGK